MATETDGKKKKKKKKRKGARRQPSRMMSLSVAAREYIWLWDYRHGMSAEEIAARTGRSLRRVRFGLERARAQERGDIQGSQGVAVGSADDETPRAPRLIPIFPLVPYTPLATCAHRGAIRSGSLFCCMVCHRSGIDEHPALLRDPRTDPAPEPKPATPPPHKKPSRETRKERRKRLFNSQLASSPSPAASTS